MQGSARIRCRAYSKSIKEYHTFVYSVIDGMKSSLILHEMQSQLPHCCLSYEVMVLGTFAMWCTKTCSLD